MAVGLQRTLGSVTKDFARFSYLSNISGVRKWKMVVLRQRVCNREIVVEDSGSE